MSVLSSRFGLWPQFGRSKALSPGGIRLAWASHPSRRLGGPAVSRWSDAWGICFVLFCCLYILWAGSPCVLWEGKLKGSPLFLSKAPGSRCSLNSGLEGQGLSLRPALPRVEQHEAVVQNDLVPSPAAGTETGAAVAQTRAATQPRSNFYNFCGFGMVWV